MPEHEKEGGKPKAVLTTITLLGVLYTASISGGYGLEDSVRSGGPLYTIVFLSAIPFFWGIPVSLAVAELACSVPSNAGPIMWVNVAFKPWMTFTTVIWTMLLNFVDNSLYPTLFADYMANMFHFSDLTRTFVKILFLWGCTLVNVFGVRMVGVFSVSIMCITLFPFIIMFFLQVPDGFNWERISHVPESINWALFLPVVCWNFSGFDSAGHIIEEVTNPKKTFPRALLLLVVMGLLTYIPPVLVGASVKSLEDVPWTKWKDGYWVKVGNAVGGRWLAWIVLAGSSISTLGLLTTLLTTTSRSLAGMGTINAFPMAISKWLSKYHPKTGTPVNALLINTAATSVLVTLLNFEVLVAVDQVLYALRIIVILSCFLKLRMKYPDLERPYTIPGGARWIWAWAVPPMTFSTFTIYMSMKGSHGLLLSTAVIILGTITVSLVATTQFKVQGFEGEILYGEEQQQEVVGVEVPMVAGAGQDVTQRHNKTQQHTRTSSNSGGDTQSGTTLSVSNDDGDQTNYGSFPPR